jgi:hypothetical protein
MYRTLLVVGVVAALVLLAGCSGTRSTSGSSWFADTNWGSRDKPFCNQGCEDRSAYTGGSDYKGNQWGSGMAAMWDPSTYNADVLAACHDLGDGKLAVSREMGARRLGELKPTSNLAIEALEDGCKDTAMNVRKASAWALVQIGTPNAMHHLEEVACKGYVPMPASNTAGWYDDYSRTFTTVTGPAAGATGVKVEQKTYKAPATQPAPCP